jgi:hypothetical protein
MSVWLYLCLSLYLWRGESRHARTAQSASRHTLRLCTGLGRGDRTPESGRASAKVMACTPGDEKRPGQRGRPKLYVAAPRPPRARRLHDPTANEQADGATCERDRPRYPTACACSPGHAFGRRLRSRPARPARARRSLPRPERERRSAAPAIFAALRPLERTSFECRAR